MLTQSWGSAEASLGMRTAVGQGGFRVLTGADMRQIFVGAFDGATYHDFDDLEGPDIHVSRRWHAGVDGRANKGVEVTE